MLVAEQRICQRTGSPRPRANAAGCRRSRHTRTPPPGPPPGCGNGRGGRAPSSGCRRSSPWARCVCLEGASGPWADPTRQLSFRPEAPGADQEVTNGLKHSRKRPSRRGSGPCGPQRERTSSRPRKGVAGADPPQCRGRPPSPAKRTRRAAGDPAGVVVAARTGEEPTRNKGSLPGCRGGARQRRVREDRGRPGQTADGPVVPSRPGNAGGGKGPWLETSERSSESPTIDHESSNVARDGSEAADLAAGES